VEERALGQENRVCRRISILVGGLQEKKPLPQQQVKQLEQRQLEQKQLEQKQQRQVKQLEQKQAGQA
jgi:hypothetical protein